MVTVIKEKKNVQMYFCFPIQWSVSLFIDLLFLCLLKLLDEFPQTAVFKALAVSGRSSDCYHIVRVF